MSLSIMLKLIFTADQLPLKLTPALKEVKFDSKIRYSKSLTRKRRLFFC